MKKINELFGDEKIPEFKKILRLMKLTVFFILISVGCVLAGKTYSQTKTLTLQVENSTVKEVLAEIEKQSEFRIMYSGKFVDVDREVSLDVKNQKIESVLNTLFAGTDVSYTVRDRFIVLVTPELMVESMLAVTQQKAVSGRVTDSEGQPLPGVTIVIKGTTQGTVTNSDGNYSLTNIPKDATLVFSFVGMRTQEVVVENQTTINITMEFDAIGIEEVVAIGYGTMKKSDLTGSVSSARIIDLQQAPNVSIGQSLQGIIPGLNVGAVNTAGADPVMTIRGQTTLSGNQDVLIVLDGIIFTGSLSSLNPNDIASIDVLKDASSTAIYGAQAANGVLLITTKRGHTDKPRINISSQFSTQNPAIVLTPMNREEFIQKNKEVMWQQAYLEPSYSTPNPDFDFKLEALLPPHWTGYDNGTSYDWWDAGTRKGLILENQISVSGQTDFVNYLFSGGYTKQNAFIKGDNFDRKTIRINLESRVRPWLLLGVQSFGSFNDYSGQTPSMGQLLRQNPLTVPYDEEGKLIVNPNDNLDLNPFIGTVNVDADKRNSFFGNFYGEIQFPFIKGLSYRINYGHNYRITNQYNSSLYEAGQTGRAVKSERFYYDYTLDNILTYSRSFSDKHDLNLTFLYGAIERKNSTTEAEATGFARLSLGYNSIQQGNLQYTRSGAWDEALLYQMGRINYKYNGKYLFTGTIRRDGYSGFSEENKYGYFPSMALGWIISEESFLDASWVDILKLRVSYGANGNMINRYASLAQVTPNIAYIFGDGGTTEFGQQVTTMGNSNLKWEKTVGFNYGTDFVFFKGRLTGNIDYYNTTTNDLLYNVSIPTMTGFSEITTNLGEIQNKGIEIILTPVFVQTKDLKWDISFNFSRNVNSIKKLVGLDADGDGVEDNLVASNLFIGESIGAVYGYELDGFYQIGDERPAAYPTGTYRIVDQNGDEEISPEDRIILGREEPAYRISAFNSLIYRNLTLRVLVNSIQGGRNSYLGPNDPGSGMLTSGAETNALRYNFVKEFDFWTPSNPNAVFRHPTSAGGIDPVLYFDRSFVRLQDISLSYNFNSKFSDKLNIADLNIFISGKNLATWTNWVGWDPELGYGLNPSNALPVLKSYSIGLNLTF